MSTNAPTTQQPPYRKRMVILIDRLSGGVEQLAAEALRPVGAEGTSAEAPAHDPTATATEASEEIARGVLVSEEQILEEARATLMPRARFLKSLPKFHAHTACTFRHVRCADTLARG